MSFDALAPHYRWLEFVLAGEKLQTCRTACLGEVRDAKHILILGEGNGRFLAECRQTLPSARITCVDASDRMLSLAKRRCERLGISLQQVEFIHADVLQWTPPATSFDLIATHFFLDCFSPGQLDHLVSKLAKAAKPDADWLLADFQIPAAGMQRRRAQVIHTLMYAFFRAFTKLPARRLTPPDEILRAHEFDLVKRNTSEWGLLHSDRWARRKTQRRP
jgi:ubiquinone/menaquinone biosynthesis C-methylase UbiE